MTGVNKIVSSMHRVLALGSLAVRGSCKARASPDCGGDGRRDNSAVRDAMFGVDKLGFIGLGDAID